MSDKTYNQLVAENRNLKREINDEIKRLKSAIKKKHLDCCIDQPNEVKLCTCTVCPIYGLRGKGAIMISSKQH